MTLAAIVFAHLRGGRTVLIAAHTNIAIDNAIMKLCELCKEARRDDLLAQGQVIRFGAVQKAELKNDPYQEVSLPSIVQRLNTQLQQEHEKCIQALKALKQRIGDLSQQQQAEMQQYQQLLEQLKVRCEELRINLQPLEEQERQRQATFRAQREQYYGELQQLERIWTETSQRLAQAKAFIVEQSSVYTRTKQEEQNSLQRLLDARAMNGMQRFFHRINLEKLEQQVGEATYRANQLLLSVQTAQDDETRYQGKMSTLESHIKEYQERIRQVDKQLNTPSAQAADIARLQSELTQTEQRYHQQKILLDQEKQLHQPELQTLSKQKQQLETQLAALDQQMRDIEKKIVENAHVVGTTLTKTSMNQAMSSRRFDAVILDEISMAQMPLIYLAATHADRSITFIGDPQQLAPIVNAETDPAKNWLKKDLFNFRGVSLGTASQGLNHSALLDIQSRMHPQIARVANTLVYQNKLHNDFDESKTRRILPLPDASKLTTPALGIITPYALQARLIQNLIKEAGLQKVVQAGTVHRFQGLKSTS